MDLINFINLVCIECLKKLRKVCDETDINEKLFWFELTTLVAIGVDCTGSCKSNFYKNTTTMLSFKHVKMKNITHTFLNFFKHSMHTRFIKLIRSIEKLHPHYESATDWWILILKVIVYRKVHLNWSTYHLRKKYWN
jgi:hypothetical protein